MYGSLQREPQTGTLIQVVVSSLYHLLHQQAAASGARGLQREPQAVAACAGSAARAQAAPQRED